MGDSLQVIFNHDIFTFIHVIHFGYFVQHWKLSFVLFSYVLLSGRHCKKELPPNDGDDDDDDDLSILEIPLLCLEQIQTPLSEEFEGFFPTNAAKE